MNKTRLALNCLLAFSFLIFNVSTRAQVATGTPPFGSYGGGPDVLNLANLNAHFTMPVLHKAGRGMAFTYDLIYDTSIWTPVTSGSTKTWIPSGNWGWGAVTQVATGYLTATVTEWEQCGYYNQKGIWIHVGDVNAVTNWAYLDKFGQSHPFPGTTYTSGSSYCPPPTYLTSLATDGSGYTLQVQASGTTVVARDGTSVVPQLNIGNGTSTVTDSNGNQISVNSSGVFTDTLGTTALTVSGGAPSPLVMTYTAPSGGNAQYTVKYSTFTVQTNFGCSGITEFAAASTSLVSEIDLPDGTKYLFNYEPTYQHTTNVTGRLASVILPTGGTISYSYGTGGVNGISCADGSAATLTRQTPDGTWTYAHSESGTAWTTLITDPQSNQTNVNFQGIYETQRQTYQGSTSGTLLKTVVSCYNGNTINCISTAVALPITQRTVTLQWPAGLQSKVNTLYNAYGMATETDSYAYGAGSPGALARKILTVYASLGNGIANLPATVTVQDGAGNVKSQSTYTYDQGTVTTTSGTPQKVSVTGSRGNLTTASFLVQGTTTLNKTYTYYDTGNLNTATDVNSALTTYNYGTGSCGNSFVTSISEPLSLSRSATWNCTGGVEISITDENSKMASTTYTDPYFWRPASTTDAASDVTNFTYSGATQVESSLLFGTSTSDLLLTLDGLGRGHLSQRKECPSSCTYDSVEADYDSDGRPYRTTLPFSASAGVGSSTAPSRNVTYDALVRRTQITDNSGLRVTFGYSQNDSLQIVGPAPAGEHTKQKQMEYDALGRLTSVCEITTLTGNGSCQQTTTTNGYWTKYTYDALNNLTGVLQNAQSGSSQTRSYAYDDLGRMTSETNPESGTTTYTYDTDATCGTSSGDLVKKVDAVGNIICFAYDALHRVTSSFVSSGGYQSSTPKKYFVYDSATVNSVVMANVKGRMAEAYTCVSPCTSKITDIGISYTALGQASDIYESMPHSNGYYHVTESFWANGVLKQLSNLVGLPTFTYGVDGEGRVYSVSASSGQNPLMSTVYNVASLPTQVNLGSSDSDTYTFDQNSNRMTQYKFSVNGQSVVGTLTWNPIGTLENLVVTDPFYSGGNQNCSYAHDDLTRVASANCGTPWSQTFNYDAFGNLSKSGTSSFQPTYSYLTNRMTQIGSSTPSYDANGNVTNDFLHTYLWDAAGRPVSADGVLLTYDALGRMVEQNRSGVYTEIVYGPGGGKLALMSGQSLQKAFVPLSGGSVAVYNSSGLAYYRHSDWLGSSRFVSTPGRTMYFDGAFAPFGEPYAQSGTADLSFTGMNQDTATNLYDFRAREYGIQGRWPSPDPAGLSSVWLGDPQSWNRYVYVRNSPLQVVDPEGLKPSWICGDDQCLGGGNGDETTALENAYGGDGWSQASCGVNPFCGVGPFTSPIAQIDCSNGQKCEVGTYEFSHQNIDGSWTVNWGAQRQAETDRAVEAFQQQLQAVATALGIDVNVLLAAQNLDDPNADHPWLHGGNWNFLLPDGTQEPDGCSSNRCGDFPSLHFSLDSAGVPESVHLDTANPLDFGEYPATGLTHVVVDIILGNTIFSSGIPRP
jgi:RHS repeat-associated protein